MSALRIGGFGLSPRKSATSTNFLVHIDCFMAAIGWPTANENTLACPPSTFLLVLESKWKRPASLHLGGFANDPPQTGTKWIVGIC